MKISYRTHPSLEILAGNYSNILVDEKDKTQFLSFSDYFIDNLTKLVQNMDRDNVIRPSLSFQEAAWEACGKKVFDNEGEFADELNGESGAMILKDRVTFFKLNKTPKNNILIQFVTFDNEYNTLMDFCFKHETTSRVNFWKSSCLENNGILDNGVAYLTWTKAVIICLLLFTKYAKVETKMLPAKQKIKGINCKYINETNLNIKYLDSKWFTNLVKSDAFKVRGHFRLQPKKKNGEWTKELIWINDFQKTGYTAPARKLSNT